MTLPRTVADVLSDHVTFEVECIDRMYLNVWQPRLAYGGGVAGFFTGHRGNLYASTALMDPMSKAFVADIHHFVAAHDLELVHFAKGQRKDEVTQRLLAGFTAAEGVLYVGRAQEKSNVWRTQRRHHADGSSYPWLVRSHRDDEPLLLLLRGPTILALLPQVQHLLSLYRQALHQRPRMGQTAGSPKAGSASSPWTTASCAAMTSQRLQAICDGLGAAKIDALLRKWLSSLPHPYSARDRQAGYRYEISILQAEFSLTQVLDRPVTGRVFFEEVIRENLDLGRPSQVS